VYYQFIDCAKECIQDRFVQRSFAVYMDTKKILLNTFSGTAPQEFAEELKAVSAHSDDDVNRGRLAIQLPMLFSTRNGD